MVKVIAEYIWLDGNKVPEIRSKIKVFETENVGSLESYSMWNFDGSSTGQAKGEDSDCILRPVRVYDHPLLSNKYRSVIVLNDVLTDESLPHSTNTRHSLEQIAKKYESEEFWFGIEQEYTLFSGQEPLGFPKRGEPDPQGKYYCGNGVDKAFGRELSEEHLFACLDAGILISGTNAEVMPGQWEYQIGAAGPLKVADDLIVARFLHDRIGEKHGIRVSLDPKPKPGDWNGAGAHTNFSTKGMRERLNEDDIATLMSKFENLCAEHIAVYGVDNNLRLTGLHETCDINTFRYGVSDRGASVRIPLQVARDGKGYLEDRRPASNMDPYLVLERIMNTVKQ